MAATAQQSPPSVGGKRKGKSQFLPAKRARRCDAGGPRQLEPGLQGILITCNMNERKCVEEAYSLLNEYGDDMYGPEKVRAWGRVSRPRASSGERRRQLLCCACTVLARPRLPSRPWCDCYCGRLPSGCVPP